MNYPFKNRQHGLSLVDALLSVVVVGVLVGAVGYSTKAFTQGYSAKARGSQYSTVLDAARRFSVKNQNNILSKLPVAGFAQYLTPTLSELKAAGFLSKDYQEELPAFLGGNLTVTLEYEPATCPLANCVLAIKVIPTTGTKDNAGQPSPKMASDIALAINGYGWTNSANNDAKLSKNNALISNPLGAVPAVVIAADWLPSNKSLNIFSSDETQTIPCPAPQSGVIVQKRTKTELAAGGYDYSPWVDVSSTCAIPPVVPPVVPPSCANGATNFPTCSFPPPVCANGATNYPTCTFPVVRMCPNGYSYDAFGAGRNQCEAAYYTTDEGKSLAFSCVMQGYDCGTYVVLGGEQVIGALSAVVQTRPNTCPTPYTTVETISVTDEYGITFSYPVTRIHTYRVGTCAPYSVDFAL
ncbi:MAG: hypothetical protein Q7T74_06960 [Candidatus Saccharibacteria bacterium]|nr:hypothetical protein [Candidatus Saccharibacteria bacterium]